MRTGMWPPPGEFFKGTPIGFVYYLQKCFVFNDFNVLQIWIDKCMRKRHPSDRLACALEGCAAAAGFPNPTTPEHQAVLFF